MADRSPNRLQAYIDRYEIDQAVLSTANTNRDGDTGTYVTLATGRDPFSQVVKVQIKATGTTTAGMIRFFHDDGADLKLIHEENVAAATPSASVQTDEITWTPSNLVLGDGELLKGSTHNAETFHVTTTLGNF